MHRGLAHLQAAEFLYETRLYPELEYTFKHALVQDTAYSSLMPGKRKQFHNRIATVLKEQFPDTVETQPELMAHHLEQAGLIEPAIGYLRIDGQRAVERSASAEAIGHLEHGLGPAVDQPHVALAPVVVLDQSTQGRDLSLLVEPDVVENQHPFGVELRLIRVPHDERAIESHLELHRLVDVRMVPERSGIGQAKAIHERFAGRGPDIGAIESRH